jgi:WD40 repeat protein
MVEQSMSENPYVGPRPFERGEKARFFGRDNEANALLSLIVAHQSVVLFAESGAGKTSLLNAQVVPMLEAEGFEVMPFTRVQGPPVEGVRSEDIANIYIFHTLLGWSDQDCQPLAVAKQSLSDFLADYPHPEDDFGYPCPRVLIFDQFEELFTTFPERWPDREGFFNQISRALQDEPLLHVVFSMREDFVAELEAYADLVPRRFGARFHLERMRPGQALDAVQGPLAGTGRQFAPEAAEQLVTDLRKVRVQSFDGQTIPVTGEFVEPVQLQVVCQNLWQDLPADVTTIDRQHLQQFGNVSQALATFYERAIGQAMGEQGVQEEDLRDWFEQKLITPAGTRGTVYRGAQETGGIPNEAIDALEDMHIIRGEYRAGARWFELTHDRLIEPIQESNQAWDESRRERWLNRLRRAVIALVVLLVVIVIGIWASGEWRRAEAESAGQEAAQAAAQATAEVQVTQVAEMAATEASITQQREAEAQMAQEAADEALAVAMTAEAEANAAATEAAIERQIAEATATAVAAIQATSDAAATASAADLMAAQAEVRRLALARPLRPGASLSGESGPTGSLTTLVRDEQGNFYFLSPASVLGGQDAGQGDPVFQPGLADNGDPALDAVAEVAVISEVEVGGATTAIPLGLATGAGDFSFTAAIPELGPLRGVGQPIDGAGVRLVGRVSQSVPGVLDSAGAGEALFTVPGVYTDLEQDPAGDYGALIVDDGGFAIGMVVGHDGQDAIGIPMIDILENLDVDLAYAGQPLAVLPATLPINSVAFSNDNVLAAGGNDFAISLWNTSDLAGADQPLGVITGHDNHVTALAFNPDGEILASGSRDNTIRIWDIASDGGSLAILDDHFGAVRALDFNAEGEQLASAGEDRRIFIYIWSDYADPPQIREISGPGDPSGHQGIIRDVAFAPDQPFLASAGDDMVVRFWYLADDGAYPEVTPFSTDHLGEINAIAFSPNGLNLATASNDRTVRVWDMAGFYESPENRPQLLATLPDPDSLLMDVVFSPDGASLVTSGHLGAIRMWDTKNLNIAPILMSAHDGIVNSLAFSPDGHQLASGSGDRSVRIWEARKNFTPQSSAADN